MVKMLFGKASLLLVLLVLLLAVICRAQGNSTGLDNPIDPIINFCMRFKHQSTIKNDILYIDGGIQTFRLGGLNYSENGTNVPSQLGVNNFVITVDMNDSWNWWTNISQSVLEKEVNPVADYTPEHGVIRGSMFAGPSTENKIYTFGGTSFRGNESFPGWSLIQSKVTPLWSYDIDSQEWTPFSSLLEERPNYGAWVEAPDKGLGFYLNGQVDNGSHVAARWLGDNTYNIPGMVVLDLNDHTMTNISTPGLPDTYPRVGGSLQYLPSVGTDGVLVSLGGAYRESGETGAFADQTLATFDSVDVFDVGSYLNDESRNGTWYSQKTTGDLPPPMIDSCVVALSSPDLSSHNIYLYGGRDPTGPNIILYDGIWALSLPSFTWTKIIGGDSPRWGHTCHIAGNRQLLTVSGSLNSTYENCDWEQRGVAIFDLSTMLWGSVFTANDQAYTVSQPIVDTIGGSNTGGATLISPVGGYNNRALEAVMTASPRDPPPRPKSRTGTIAGAVVGSCAGVLISAALIFFLLRRRKRKIAQSRRESAIELAGKEQGELPGQNQDAIEASGEDTKYEMAADPAGAELPGQEFVAYEMAANDEIKKVTSKEEQITDIILPEESAKPQWSELTDVKEKPQKQRTSKDDAETDNKNT